MNSQIGKRLACGGAVHLGREPSSRNAGRRKHAFAERGGKRHPPLWRTLVEPVLTALAVVLIGGLIGFGLFVVGR
jgi:hypothetical protein